MKTTRSSPWGLSRYFLATLLLSPLTAQTITNPSFEANNFTIFPGYTNNNGPITGWTASPADRVGLNPSAGSPFANNGAIPSGSKVAFIQNNPAGVSTLKTIVTGLTPETRYNVSFRMNARAQGAPNRPFMTFSTDGAPTVHTEVSQVSGATDGTPYHFAAFEFVATGTSQEITLSNIRSAGDHTVVVDDFAIAPSSNAWSFSPWTGDEDSEIDPQFVYTHAYSFGSNDGVTINDVRFIGREAGTPGRFALSGLNAGFQNKTPNDVTGNSAALAKDFRYGGSPGITLQNLKPNTQYVATVYGIGFDAPDSASPYRSSTFSSSVAGSQKFTVDLNQYGEGDGIKVTYAYTTDANGTPVTINYPTHGTGTFHTSAFSNREVIASSPAPAWTSQPWTDDQSSGVDGSYVYTHALNFGTAATVNLNGVNFTGIAGGSPIAPGYSSNIPQTYTGDLGNFISGAGEELTRDFIHGGFPGVHELAGLTPGKEYIFTIYSTGFEAPGGRFNAFYGNREDAPVFIDQSQYGVNSGIRIEYRYTAKADGTAQIISSAYSPNASIHVCGISNRETTPTVGIAPDITLQPADKTIGVGKAYTLRVGAVGSGTLSYQWKKNNVNIPGATDPTLEFPELQYSDSGDYSVTVTSADGTANSEVATLLVIDNVAGVFASGVGPDGQPLLGGSIDPHFTLIANPDNPESSSVFVETSLPGSWIGNGASKWVGPRVDTNAAAGAPAADGEGEGIYVYRMVVDLTGFDVNTLALNGRWSSDNSGITIRVNGTDVTGTDNTVGNTFSVWKDFTLNSSNSSFVAGINNLDFVVKNDIAGLTGLRVDRLEAIGVIAPGTLPHIAVQPMATVGRHNESAVLGVSANGTGPLSYQWYFNGSVIPGETESILSIPIIDYLPAGNYKVEVTNAFGTVMSSEIPLTITNANPVPVEDQVAADKDTPLEIDAFVLSSNDTDADGDLLEITGVSATSAQGGDVVLDGSFITYTPPEGFVGQDSFTYTVEDGLWGGSATGNVVITVSAIASGEPSQITLVISGGTASGTFTGTPGASYTIQRSIDLEDWDDLETVVAPPSGIVTVEDANPPDDKAFYRISYTP